MEALGPPAFNFCGKRFTRTDFTLRTKRGYNLECSHWEPVERATDRIPVVIYMHGNSSARVEVIPQLSYLLSLGLAVFAFDFAGSGKSDGDYVSLGHYEREDLSCIVAHLRATNIVSTIALWGRSMGAATALMYGDRDPSIACMILDSPFADLTQLCEELVEKGREQGIVVPNFVVALAIRMLQGSVKKQAGFNIKSISPISHADKCFIPALFVAGEHDDFIKKHHSEQIHEVYAGDKNLIVVEGDHNSPRPKFMFDSASIFLQTCLQIPNSWALPVPVSMNLMCPPWYFDLYQQRSSRRKQEQAAKKANGAPARDTPAANDKLATGFNSDEVGMTAERQRVIQASLFKMLGQADGPLEYEDPASKPAAKVDEKEETSAAGNE
jgi:pimeloyl-ACP methyl ester carboxylesterase